MAASSSQPQPQPQPHRGQLAEYISGMHTPGFQLQNFRDMHAVVLKPQSFHKMHAAIGFQPQEFRDMHIAGFDMENICRVDPAGFDMENICRVDPAGFQPQNIGGVDSSFLSQSTGGVGTTLFQPLNFGGVDLSSFQPPNICSVGTIDFRPQNFGSVDTAGFLSPNISGVDANGFQPENNFGGGDNQLADYNFLLPAPYLYHRDYDAIDFRQQNMGSMDSAGFFWQNIGGMGTTVFQPQNIGGLNTADFLSENIGAADITRFGGGDNQLADYKFLLPSSYLYHCGYDAIDFEQQNMGSVDSSSFFWQNIGGMGTIVFQPQNIGGADAADFLSQNIDIGAADTTGFGGGEDQPTYYNFLQPSQSAWQTKKDISILQFGSLHESISGSEIPANGKTADSNEGSCFYRPQSSFSTDFDIPGYMEHKMQFGYSAFEKAQNSASNSRELSNTIPTPLAPFEDIVYPEGDPDAVTISQRDVDLLQPETFVNDTIIDFYIKYLNNTIPPCVRQKYHFFNSFFFRKLADLDKHQGKAPNGRAAFLGVRKWTRKVNLFEKDFLFIPVNFESHWSLLVICHPGEVATFQDDNVRESPKVPCILHMNSIEGTHNGLKDIIQSYLWEEWNERHPKAANNSEKFFKLKFLSAKVPQQDNLFDCGLFLLHYMELFLVDTFNRFNPLKADEFSSFVTSDWFPPAEASLKRLVIKNLIYELLHESSGNVVKMIHTNEHHNGGCPRNHDVEQESDAKFLSRIQSAGQFPSACTVRDDTIPYDKASADGPGIGVEIDKDAPCQKITSKKAKRRRREDDTTCDEKFIGVVGDKCSFIKSDVPPNDTKDAEAHCKRRKVCTPRTRQKQ